MSVISSGLIQDAALCALFGGTVLTGNSLELECRDRRLTAKPAGKSVMSVNPFEINQYEEISTRSESGVV